MANTIEAIGNLALNLPHYQFGEWHCAILHLLPNSSFFRPYHVIFENPHLLDYTVSAFEFTLAVYLRKLGSLPNFEPP